MLYSDFCSYLEHLDKTSKRLELIDILGELLKALEPQELAKATYLSLGILKPKFEDQNFNIAEKTVIKALELAFAQPTSTITNLYAKTGDLGSVCLELAPKPTHAYPKTTLLQVYDTLLSLARLAGEGSQDEKITTLAKLLNSTEPLSAKYLVRTVLGTTRLGFTELTIIEALSKILADQDLANKTALATITDKTYKPYMKTISDQLEYRYNIHPDIGLLAQLVLTQGLTGLNHLHLEPGVPIEPQKCQRVANLEELYERLPTAWLEYKFDGTRIQLHFDKTKPPKKKLNVSTLPPEASLFATNKPFLIETYTRSLDETSHQYPDLITAAQKQIAAQSVILDGEAMGFDPKSGAFLPFQEIMQRKRKYDITEMAKQIPLVYFVFDILYKDGQELTQLTLKDRNAILQKTILPGEVFVPVIDYETTDEESLTAFFETARAKHLEGIIAKNPDALYQAGARSYNWMKYKIADKDLLQDTLDCVIVGYSYGKGARADFGIGKFLACIWDPKVQAYKTITKVGTGLTDDEWRFLKQEADKHITAQAPKNLVSAKQYTQDVWLTPKIVVELSGDELSKSTTHTAGYALRFPRLIKFRPDKNVTQLTTLEEVETLYKLQKKGYHT